MAKARREQRPSKPEPPETYGRLGDRRAILLLLGVLVIAYGDVLFLGRAFFDLDIHSYHYPMKHTVRELVLSGEMPYWNPLLSSGAPLAANPAYELWYPLQWLIFLPSYFFGFQLHIVVHFLLAAVGTYLLVRSLGGGAIAAILGALAFAFCGPYLSLTNKLTLLFACSWMPLALFFAREVLERWRWPMFAGAALSLGMQLLLGEPTYLLQTWAFIAGLALLRTWRTRGSMLRRDAMIIGSLGITTVLVAAAQLVPALDFARDTVRSQPFQYHVVTNWSMPLVRPIEMLFPALLSHVEGNDGQAAITSMYALRNTPFLGSLYVGMLLMIVAVAGVLTRRRGAGLFLAVFAISVVAAAGEHTPLARVLYDLGLIGSMRFPEKFILSAALATIVWAALLFDHLRSDRKLGRTAFRVAVAAAIVLLLIGLGVRHSESLGTRSWLLVNLVRVAVVIALVGPLRTRLRAPVWAVAVVVLTVIDLAATTHSTAPRTSKSFFDPPPLVASLPETSQGRIFHRAAWDAGNERPIAHQWLGGKSGKELAVILREGLFPNLPNLYGRALAIEEDIDSTALRNSEEFRQTLMLALQHEMTFEELQLLRMANVKWRIDFRPYEEGEANPVRISPVNGHPRFAFADAIERRFANAAKRSELVAVVDDLSFTPSPGEVEVVRERPTAIDLVTRNSGRGLLLISITAHKYWRATVDGRPSPLIPANLTYQVIDLPPGEHSVALRYRNPLVIPSAVVSLLTLMILAAVTARDRMRRSPASPTRE